MKVNWLACQNYMCFGGYHEIDLSDKKIIGLIGVWNENPLKSNRAGKSTFIEMIRYAIYGKFRADKEIELIHHGAEDDMFVIIDFEMDNCNYRIKRGRTVENKLILELEGFEGSKKKEAQEAIDEIFGIDAEEFALMNFFKQSDINAFMELGATDQKKMLIKWQNDRVDWKIYEQQAKNEISTLKTSIDRFESFIKENENEIDSVEFIIEEIKQTKVNIAELEKQRDGIVNDIDEAKSILKDYDSINTFKKSKKDLEKLLAQQKKQLIAIKNNAEDYKTKLNQLDSLQSELDILEEKLSVYESGIDIESVQKQENEKIALRAKLEADNERLSAKLKSIKKFGGSCPVTGSECGIIDSKKEKEEINSMLDDNKKEIDVLDMVIDDLNEYKNKGIKQKKDRDKLVLKIESIKDSIDRIDQDKIKYEIDNLKSEYKNQMKSIAKTERDIKVIDEQIETLENEVDVDFIKEQLMELDFKLKSINQKLSRENATIGSRHEKLKSIKEIKTKIEKYQSELPDIKNELYQWQYVQFMFSKNGIQSYLIESSFAELEGDANYILEKLQSNMSIKIESEKELDQWEEKCNVCGFIYPKKSRKKECEQCGCERSRKKRDELQIMIETNGSTEKFCQNSGGGKTILSLAIRMATIMMKRRKSNKKVNILILDEIFAPLDKVNKSQIIKLITDILINEMYFDQIFIISHDQEVIDMIPDIIEVRKYETYSEFAFN